MSKGRMPNWACGPFLLALLLCACGDRSRPSAEESDQLNNAAEMLDSAPDALANIDDNSLVNADANAAGESAPDEP
jgi:hypothetical protein